MKYILLFVAVCFLSSCSNGFKCMFTDPDQMSPRLYKLCHAEAGASKSYSSMNVY